MDTNFNFCIVCLSKKVSKDVKSIKIVNRRTDVQETETINGFEIVKFCLDIEIHEVSMYTQFCLKCYRKLTLFYKFKVQAQKNNEYLTNQSFHVDEDLIKKEVKTEYSSEDLQLMVQNVEINQDIEDAEHIKEEYGILDFGDINSTNDSDNEFLSVLQQSKSKDKDIEVEPDQKCKALNSVIEQVCDFCGKKVRNLKEHMERHRPLSQRKVIQCKYCTKTFSSYSAHYKHNKIKHLGIKRKCDVCNKFVVDLNAHRRLMHESELLVHRCTACPRAFLSRSALEQHTSLHTKSTPHSCPDCGKSFRLKLTMIQHRKQVHEQIKSHLCQYCSKSFFKKYHLQIHLRTHTKEKPYVCIECGKRFATSCARKTHLVRHSGIKKFNCTLCDMNFINNGALKTHMISHTKERSHECQYCGRRFGRSDHRRRHERTAHPATTIHTDGFR